MNPIELIAEVVAAVILAISAPATGPYEPAVRLNPPPPPTTVAPVPTGLWGQPFAPPGLSACDNAEFYRVQWSLPERFRQITWREANCRNEDGVRTSCCHSRYQLWVALHMKDHRIAPRYAACGVSTFHDINSDTELDKQRAACAAKALFDVVGYSAWSATA